MIEKSLCAALLLLLLLLFDLEYPFDLEDLLKNVNLGSHLSIDKPHSHRRF